MSRMDSTKKPFMKIPLASSRNTDAYTYAIEESKYAPVSRRNTTRVPAAKPIAPAFGWASDGGMGRLHRFMTPTNEVEEQSFQVLPRDSFAGGDLISPPVGEQPPFVDQEKPVGHLAYLGDDVAREEDRAVRAEAPEEIAERDHLQRIEPV